MPRPPFKPPSHYITEIMEGTFQILQALDALRIIAAREEDGKPAPASPNKNSSKKKVKTIN